MRDDRPPELEMRIDGSFHAPPRPPILTRVFVWAIGIAVLAGALAMAAFALWLALILVPVALIAGVIAWAAFRFQIWRARNAAQRRRDVWRS